MLLDFFWGFNAEACLEDVWQTILQRDLPVDKSS